MAKFIFKMENILSIKFKLEDQAKAEYGMELARLHEEELKLEALHVRKQRFETELSHALTDVLEVMEIRRLEESVENIKYNIQIQLVVIREQEQRVAKAREKLDEAMKERKTYEKLKENAFEVFKAEINAQEQKEVDELVSFRFQNALESEG